jgi:glycerol-3-phosphate acyltransferase PlsY
MLVAWTVLAICIAYLLGSIPTAVWVGQYFFGIDVRQHGSKNAGATNTFRVLGKKPGITVLSIDLLKGFLAALIPFFLERLGLLNRTNIVEVQLACGVAAVTGHILPIFAKFKGGKGVATLAGMMLGIHPIAVGSCIVVFLVVLVLFGYVSLGSIVAALSFPVFLVTRSFGDYNTTLLLFGIVMSCGIVYTHKKNIKRLLQGEESKTYLWGKSGKHCAVVEKEDTAVATD